MKKYTIGHITVYANNLNEALQLAEEVRKECNDYYGDYNY